MYSTYWWNVGTILFFLNLVGVAKADESHSIIDRALKAGGGTEKISRFKAVRFKAEATLGDEKRKLNGVFGGAALFRVEFELKDKNKLILIGGGDVFWIKNGNENFEELRVGDKNDVDLSRIASLNYCISLPDQLLALKRKGYKLTVIGDAEVNSAHTVALRVNHELHPEVTMYFDKESGLPVKCQMKLPPPKGGLEQLRYPNGEVAEIYFDKYKEVQGVQHFTLLRIRTEDRTLEIRLTDIELLEKVVPETFKKPS